MEVLVEVGGDGGGGRPPGCWLWIVDLLSGCPRSTPALPKVHELASIVGVGRELFLAQRPGPELFESAGLVSVVSAGAIEELEARIQAQSPD